jgi:hypothetical protein
VVQEAEYLRSYATQAGTDIRYVGGRISKASQAFGAPKRCLFRGQAQCVLTGCSTAPSTGATGLRPSSLARKKWVLNIT